MGAPRNLLPNQVVTVSSPAAGVQWQFQPCPTWPRGSHPLGGDLGVVPPPQSSLRHLRIGLQVFRSGIRVIDFSLPSS